MCPYGVPSKSILDDPTVDNKANLHRTLTDRSAVKVSSPAGPNEMLGTAEPPGIQRRDTNFLNADNLLGALTALGAIFLGGGTAGMAVAGGAEKLLHSHEEDVKFNEDAQLTEDKNRMELFGKRMGSVWDVEEDVFRKEHGLDKRGREPTSSLHSAMQMMAAVAQSGGPEEFDKFKVELAKSMPEYSGPISAMSRESAAAYVYGPIQMRDTFKNKDRMVTAATQAFKAGNYAEGNRLLYEATGEITRVSKLDWSEVLSMEDVIKLQQSGFFDNQDMESLVIGLGTLKRGDPARYDEAMNYLRTLDPIQFRRKALDLLSEAEINNLTPYEMQILKAYLSAQFQGIPGMMMSTNLLDPSMHNTLMMVIRKALSNAQQAVEESSPGQGNTGSRNTSRQRTVTQEGSAGKSPLVPSDQGSNDQQVIKDAASEFDKITGDVIDSMADRMSFNDIVRAAEGLLNEAERKGELKFFKLDDNAKPAIIRMVKERLGMPINEE